jgi:sugar-specific transcriptional regulator TrmB
MATLRDLGLSEYEARTYRALLGTGPATARDLSRTSDVPMGRIYDVLNALEADRLVRSQQASRPKKYVAVEPETALDRLLDAKRRELREQVAQYESVVEELSETLTADTVDDDGFWTVAVGAEESLDLLVERLAAADERILLVAGMPSPQLDLGQAGERVAAALEAAADRGVSVSLLVASELVETLPAGVQRRYREGLADHPEFDARAVDGVDGTFDVVDSDEVCIEVPNPLRRNEAFAMLDFKDRSFAANVREDFERRWERAERLSL